MEFNKANQIFKSHLVELGRPQTTIVAYSKDIQQLLGHLETKGLSNLLEVEFEHLNEFIENLKISCF